MKIFKVAVLISGNGSNLQALIDNFKKEESNVDINCVISNKKDAFGLVSIRFFYLSNTYRECH